MIAWLLLCRPACGVQCASDRAVALTPARSCRLGGCLRCTRHAAARPWRLCIVHCGRCVAGRRRLQLPPDAAPAPLRLMRVSACKASGTRGACSPVFDECRCSATQLQSWELTQPGEEISSCSREVPPQPLRPPDRQASMGSGRTLRCSHVYTKKEQLEGRHDFAAGSYNGGFMRWLASRCSHPILAVGSQGRDPEHRGV